jgi:hypothetical protein
MELRAAPGPRAFDPNRDEFLRDASVAPMQDANDHFLPDVATLGEGNRTRLDAGLERNRLLRHIDPEHGIRGLNPRRRDGIVGHSHGA